MSDSLKYHIEAMERKLEDQSQMIDGKYNRKYFALKSKIKNKKAELDKLKWNEFLSK